MKIVITAIAPDIDAQVDPRFGRGAYFLVVDADTLEWHAEANPVVHSVKSKSLPGFAAGPNRTV